MCLFFLICWSLVTLSRGLIYIDKVEIDSNRTLIIVDVQYRNSKNFGFESNVSVQTFREIAKGIIYFKTNTAAHKNDNEYTMEVLRTQIDIAKLLKGYHGNPLLKGVMRNVLPQIADLNITMPLAPVSPSFIGSW